MHFHASGRERRNYSIALIYTFDPRGQKIGGLETYSRDFITLHPDNVRLLMIGIDGLGDLELGKIVPIQVNGRKFDFLPVIHYPESQINKAASRLLQSVTLRFAAGLLRRLPMIRRVLRESGYTVDCRRVELGPLCWAFGVPYIQMMHTEGAPKLPMDSLVRNYRFVYNAIEAFTVRTCARFLCVNPHITERMRASYPKYADKIDTLTTWFNPALYKPTPFHTDDDIFRIVFCGRLDVFKSPALMFRTIRKVWEKRGGRGVEFNYIGASDTDRFPEFDLIRAITVKHGFRKPSEIAVIHRSMHAGILTSVWEGMPRCVLETAGAGRPTAAISLPQLEPVIHDGVSGYLVPRREDEEAMAEELSDKLLETWNGIRIGSITPDGVAALVAEFTPQRLLGKVFQYHCELQDCQLILADA